MKEHLAVIAAFIMFMSGLTVVVGMLGLASAMNINLVESRREISVTRAIEASGRAMSRMIAVEALVIGIMSWLLAVILAPPLSYAIGSIFGTILFKSLLTAIDISREADVPMSKIYVVLSRLENGGWISVVPERPKLYRAVDPAITVENACSQAASRNQVLTDVSLRTSIMFIFVAGETDHWAG